MKRVSIDMAAAPGSSRVADVSMVGATTSPSPTGAEGALVRVLGALMQTVALMEPRAAEQLREAIQAISRDLFVREDAAGLDTLAALGV